MLVKSTVGLVQYRCATMAPGEQCGLSPFSWIPFHLKSMEMSAGKLISTEPCSGYIEVHLYKLHEW